MEGTKEEFDLIDKYLRKKFTRAFVKSDMVISEWIDYSRAWDKGNKTS